MFAEFFVFLPTISIPEDMLGLNMKEDEGGKEKDVMARVGFKQKASNDVHLHTQSLRELIFLRWPGHKAVIQNV